MQEDDPVFGPDIGPDQTLQPQAPPPTTPHPSDMSVTGMGNSIAITVGIVI